MPTIITFTFFSFDVVVSRYFLADRLVTDITIEQFLPQRKPRHYEHVVLNVVLNVVDS